MKNNIKKSPKNCNSLGNDDSRATESAITLCQDDITSLNKVQDEIKQRFTPKKKKTLVLAKSYDFISSRKFNSYDDISGDAFFNRSLRVGNCGTYLEFHCNENKAKLHASNFCKDRLCPMCNWRRSMKIGTQVTKVMDVLEQSDKYDYLFLTLTVKNCQIDELSQSLDLINKGWRFLYNKDKIFKKTVVGSFRSLEITYNKKSNTWHPHLHIVVVVEKSYYAHHYLRQDQWCLMWKAALGVDYVPVCDVRRISKVKDIRKSVAEVTKYAVKDSDYLSFGTEKSAYIIEYLLPALYHRRLCAFTGVMLDAARQLGLDDMEKGDLVHLDDEIRADLTEVILKFHWLNGIYSRI